MASRPGSATFNGFVQPLLTKRGIQLAYGELKWCVTKCSKPPIVLSKWTAGIWEFPELVSEDTPGSTASYCRKHALNR